MIKVHVIYIQKMSLFMLLTFKKYKALKKNK